jgi:transcriptional regulator GlxA family with amidase domain
MHIAILTFDGFNELDSFIALGLLNRVKRKDWRVTISCPTDSVTSMNGVTVLAQSTIEEACAADAVIIGSGVETRALASNENFLAQLKLDPARQLLGAQCSGALILAKLGILGGAPVCTDLTTKPWVLEAGAEVLSQPFYASGNIATAGGCLASLYLASWIVARLEGEDAARSAMHYIAPVGEKDTYVSKMIENVQRYI